jgi:hypothetical protein
MPRLKREGRGRKLKGEVEGSGDMMANNPLSGSVSERARVSLHGTRRPFVYIPYPAGGGGVSLGRAFRSPA